MGFPVWMTRLKIVKDASNIWSFFTSITSYIMHHHHLHQWKSIVIISCWRLNSFTNCVPCVLLCVHLVFRIRIIRTGSVITLTPFLHLPLWSSREVPSWMHISNDSIDTNRSGLFFLFLHPIAKSGSLPRLYYYQGFFFSHYIFSWLHSDQCSELWS